METATPVVNLDNHVAATPPATVKDFGKVAPNSVETAAETPIGSSPESFQVVKLADLDDRVAATPPAAVKDSGKVAPNSVETAAETPIGLSPESFQVVQLAETPLSPPMSKDVETEESSSEGTTEAELQNLQTPENIETPQKPRRERDSSDGIAEADLSQLPAVDIPQPISHTLISQMQNAIPSPASTAVSVEQVEELDISVLSIPSQGSPSVTTPDVEKKEAAPSSDISFKPSKLTFSEDIEDTEDKSISKEDLVSSPSAQEDSPGSALKDTATIPTTSPVQPESQIPSNVAAAYPMQSVQSWASVPFDCVPDVRQGIFPPPPQMEPDLFVEEPLEERNSSSNGSPKNLARTLFGWIEAARTPSPIKAKVLSDRDVGLRSSRNIALGMKPSSPLRVVDGKEGGKKTFTDPSYDAQVLNNAMQYEQDDFDPEDEPPRIAPVKVSIAEALEKKRMNPTRYRDWKKTIFIMAVGGLFVLIVALASVLVARNKAAKRASNGDDYYDDDTVLGGFFSTNNEYCSSAVTIDRIGVKYSGTTTISTWDPSIDTCGDSMSIGQASWFVYVPSKSRLMEASTCEGTDFDTQITIASGDNCEELTCVTFDDEGCGSQSRAVWFAMAGQRYFINVHGFREEEGDFQLALRVADSNDICLQAAGPVSIGSSIFGTTSGATIENSSVDECGDVSLSSHPGVWYVVEDVEGWVRAEAVSRHMGFIPQLSVYGGFGCDSLSCEGGSSTGSLKWKARRGERYYVLVNGLNIEEGDFDLSISREWQDTCEFAIPVVAGGAPVAASTTEARLHNVPRCGDSGFHNAPGMWFKVIGTGGLLSASTCGPKSPLDSHISVFRNSCNALQCIGSTGQDTPCGETGAVSWASEAGAEYSIYVSGRGMRVGEFALRVKDAVAEGGNVCNDAIALGSASTTILGSTSGMLEVDTTCGGIASARGVWYELEGSGSAVTLWTCDPKTNFDARVSIFTGSCDRLSCEAHTAATCSELDEGPLTVNTVAGVKYFLLVHGPTANEVGSFALTLQEEVTNDSCTTAMAISSTTSTFFGNTASVPARTGKICNGILSENEDTFSEVKGVWYTFLGNGGLFALNTCHEDTTFDAEITVFTGSCFSQECVETEVDPCGKNKVVSFQTNDQEVYYVRVSGADATKFGNFVLGVSVRSVFFGL